MSRMTRRNILATPEFWDELDEHIRKLNKKIEKRSEKISFSQWARESMEKKLEKERK